MQIDKLNEASEGCLMQGFIPKEKVSIRLLQQVP